MIIQSRTLSASRRLMLSIALVILGTALVSFYGRFLALDVLGELVWIALYGGLGYAFADQWETVSDLAGNLTGALIGLLALVVGGALAYRMRRRRGIASIVADPGVG